MNQERNVNALFYYNLCLDEFPDFRTMMQNVEEQLNLAERVRKLAPTKLVPHRLSENEPAVDVGGPRQEYFTIEIPCFPYQCCKIV